MGRYLDQLASTDTVPLSSIGRESNPTYRSLLEFLAQPRADINGPMPSEDEIRRYLSLTGQIYPTLPPVNPAGWEAFLERAPESLNIEDRRGINRKR